MFSKFIMLNLSMCLFLCPIVGAEELPNLHSEEGKFHFFEHKHKPDLQFTFDTSQFGGVVGNYILAIECPRHRIYTVLGSFGGDPVTIKIKKGVDGVYTGAVITKETTANPFGDFPTLTVTNLTTGFTSTKTMSIDAAPHSQTFFNFFLTDK